jgi:hypothetical protein
MRPDLQVTKSVWYWRNNRMADDKKRTQAASDMAAPEYIDGIPGVRVATKLRVEGMLYLEEKYDCSLDEIDFDRGRVSDFIHLAVALAKSHQPNIAEDAVRSAVAQLDADQLRALAERWVKAFAIDLKNLKKPAKKKAGA